MSGRTYYSQYRPNGWLNGGTPWEVWYEPTALTPFLDEVEGAFDLAAERIRHPVYQLDLQLAAAGKRSQQVLRSQSRDSARRRSRGRCPCKADDECMTELRWIYDRRTIDEARQDLAAWLKKWGKRYQKLCDWVEANIEETLTFYRLPRQHHKNMKSTNLLERLNEEIKRRTLVVRIFPNTASCLRLVRALAVEMHENWIEAIRYLNMEYLKEHKKEQLRKAAA